MAAPLDRQRDGGAARPSFGSEPGSAGSGWAHIAPFMLRHPGRHTAQVFRDWHPVDVLADIVLGDAFREPRLEKARREIAESKPDHFWIGRIAKAYCFVKPVANGADDLLRFITMILDVDSGQVGQSPFEVMLLFFQDQVLFVSHEVGAMEAGAIIDAELERHVHSVELASTRGLETGEVVDAELGMPDQLANLVEPALSGIGPLRGDSRTVTQIDDREQERAKKVYVFVIERAVDEDVPLIAIDCASERSAAHFPSFGG